MGENQKEEETPAPKRKKRIAVVVFAGVVLAGAVAGYFYLQYRQTHLSTDDAFVASTVHAVAPRVAGTVARVAVADNERVREGDVLLELDPEVFEQSVQQGQAMLAAERRRIAEIEATIATQERKVAAAAAAARQAEASRTEGEARVQAQASDVAAKKALAHQADRDWKRNQRLRGQGVVSQEVLDRAATTHETALAALQAAEDLLTQTRVALRVQDAVIEQAEAGLRAEEAVGDQLRATLRTQRERVKAAEAELALRTLELSYTRVRAPGPGYVTRKSVEVGDRLQPGRTVMSVVSLSDAYVVANYKETDLGRIRPGQAVELTVDAYPDVTFRGRVESIMAGTGSAFSLFPPENATGNFVKVVQRVPVKIVVEEGEHPDRPLRVGMSVVPTVLVR